jgi:hypothetical protein
MTAKSIPAAAVQQNIETIVKTQADAALEFLQAQNRARLARDDAQRERDPKVRMVCVTAYTVCDDPANPAGRAVQVGEEMMVAASDVFAMTGRCRLKTPPVAPEGADRPRPTILQ